MKLSIFFPAHNEVDNIGRVVEKARAVAAEVAEEYEVIVVNDGSKDGTRELADDLAAKYPEVRAVHHDVNRGYGGALKSGFQAARYEYIFFSDGDGQFDLSEIQLLLPHVPEHDLVIGYRIKRSDPFYRWLNAKMYALFIRMLHGLKVRDIDCAFKLMKREIFDSVHLKSDGALISAELLIRCQHEGYKWTEVGVHHYPREFGEQTGAKLKVILRMFREVWKLRRELRGEDRAARRAGEA